MDGLLDFVGVAIDFCKLEGVVIMGVGGCLPGCDFRLNLRDFRSEALVLGNCTAACFDDEAEEESVADAVDVWVAFAVVRGFSFVKLCLWVSEVPLRRRFFWGGTLFILSDIDEDAEGEVNKEGGGPLETFWHLSVPNVRRKREETIMLAYERCSRSF